MSPGRKQKDKCCTFDFPDIPTPWLLFIEFAFTFGTTIVYFADIVTDVVTLRVYWINDWHYAFAISLTFIILPSILLAVLEYRFLKKTHGKSFTWKTILPRTILNVPFQLTLIWYHCRLTYTFFSNWLDDIRGVDKEKTTSQWYGPTTLERSRGASLSSLNELDFYHRTVEDEDSNIQGSAVVSPPAPANLSLSLPSLAAIDGVEGEREKSSWWQRLTREQWLSHLNTLKLSESMLESLPQLLINLYVIAYYKEESYTIQYLSAVLSYLSLCGGVVRYDKTRKDNEADQWMVDRTLLHSRASHTRLEWPQILFIAMYKGSFLAARILAFVFFTLFYSWYILIPILIHWGIILCYFVYRWYPDFSKVSRQLQQADYKYRAYLFLSHDFMSVFHASLMAIFIHVRPYYHAFIDQPYCFMFWYYVVYVTENIALFLLPGIIYSLQGKDDSLKYYEYYALMATDLFLNAAGCALCTVYYLAVHKMRAFTAHAYPTAAGMLCCCCRSDPQVVDEEEDLWLPVRSGWTVCKQAETSEIFFLTKEQLKSFHQTYNTVVRKDRLKGRAVECFIDDRCKIFYAPRSKMRKMTVQGFNTDSLPRPSLRRLKDTSSPDPVHNDILRDEGRALLDERTSSDRREMDRSVSFEVDETAPKEVERTAVEADIRSTEEATEPEPVPVLKPVPKARTSIKRVRAPASDETSLPYRESKNRETSPDEVVVNDVDTDNVRPTEVQKPVQQPLAEEGTPPRRPHRSVDAPCSSGRRNHEKTSSAAESDTNGSHRRSSRNKDANREARNERSSSSRNSGRSRRSHDSSTSRSRDADRSSSRKTREREDRSAAAGLPAESSHPRSEDRGKEVGNREQDEDITNEHPGWKQAWI